MYPERELTRLAAHKAQLRANIAVRRSQCADAIARVSTPLEWLDRAVAFWHNYSSLIKIAAVPLGIVVKRVVFPRFKFFGALARWGPLAYGAFRGLSSILGSNGPSPRDPA
jgi:hypothetical protein